VYLERLLKRENAIKRENFATSLEEGGVTQDIANFIQTNMYGS
jgi:hypothetical protein